MLMSSENNESMSLTYKIFYKKKHFNGNDERPFCWLYKMNQFFKQANCNLGEDSEPI
jgi:hypothetical protein